MKYFSLWSSSKQAFSKCKFMSHSETKPSIWKPSDTSFPVSAEELGDVRGSHLPRSLSLVVNKKFVC